ncbi:MAG: sulfur transferase domain-containing protein, partial [Acidobacteriota bacterium]
PTPEQLAEAAQAGYSTVVNLRPPGENSEWDEATQAADLGLRYVNIPIAGAADLNADNAALLAEIVNDPATGPLMVHCASGNRVGGLFAMKAFHVDGKSAEEAMQIGREAGLTSLAEPVREGLVR